MDFVTYIIFFVVSFGACIVGAICGIGGGVIIKPTLDAVGVLPVSTISFLSGCTVLAMSLYSVLKGRGKGDSQLDMKVATPLAIGAAAGGILGKMMFEGVKRLFADADMVGGVQAACLLIVTLGTLLYTVKKEQISTRRVKSPAVCVVIGLVLGVMSSFLGIGGGPINLVVLFYFFSMNTKTAALNSLYIILFSQITSFLQTMASGKVPEFDWKVLVTMVGAGLLGGFLGRKVNRRMDGQMVDKLFMVLMLVICGINVYNIYRFMC